MSRLASPLFWKNRNILDDAEISFTNESHNGELGTNDNSPVGADVYFSGSMPIILEAFSPETDSIATINFEAETLGSVNVLKASQSSADSYELAKMMELITL